MNKKIIKKFETYKLFLKNFNIEKIFKILSFIGINGYFFSFHLRPKKVDRIINDSIEIKDNTEKLGIILQGIIDSKNDFTYETIKLYKRLYPKSEIILSIWDDEDKKEILKIKKLGITVLENKKPKLQGFINLNYQIISTKNAILKAEELKCEYILKSRTDIRIYETGIDKFLISLLKSYPSECKFQNERIIGIDINTHRYGIGISDIFQFGTLEEMKKMWQVELTTNLISRDQYLKFEKCSTAIDRFNIEFSECYLLKKYLLKNKIILEPTLKSYYKVLKENFIIIDSAMINLYWDKYIGDEYKNWKNYDKLLSNSSMSFKDWLIITKNNVVPKEKILNLTYQEWQQKTIEEI